MRATVSLLGFAILTAVLAAPRAGHCCGLAARGAGRTALIVTASAGNAARVPLRGLSSGTPVLPEIAAASPFEARLQILPTWTNSFGRTHAGFAIAGRF